MVRLEGLGKSKKKKNAPYPGLDLATYRLVA
jgi:hypothetical protein